MANTAMDWACPIIRGIPFLVCCYVLFAAWLFKLFPQPRVFFTIAAIGAITFLLTDQISGSVIKHIFHRLRPCNNPDIGSRLLIENCGVGYSFVSSHAANSFGIAMFLVTIISDRSNFGLILATWASLVAFSQVYVGVHFPADVIGGAMVGVFIGLITGFYGRRFVFPPLPFPMPPPPEL